MRQRDGNAVGQRGAHTGADHDRASSLPPGEWQVLFDGTATDALRGYGMDGFPADRWVVEDGELRTVPGSGIDLVTHDTFGDFELEFEWRVAPGGNSGVMYRVVETAEPAWTTGPEYQVLDDALHPDGREPTTSAAALYDLIAPEPNKRLEPVGSFNRGRIVVQDGRVEHWLNGELVVTYDWDDPAVRDLVAASKFASLDGFHGGRVRPRRVPAPRRGRRVPGDPDPIGWVPDGRAATLATWPNAIPMTSSASREAPARRPSRPPGGGSPGSTIRT